MEIVGNKGFSSSPGPIRMYNHSVVFPPSHTQVKHSPTYQEPPGLPSLYMHSCVRIYINVNIHALCQIVFLVLMPKSEVTYVLFIFQKLHNNII